MNTKLIHISWRGPVRIRSKEQAEKSGELACRGLYQIYGGNPTYGGSSLLYIGLAVDQTIGERVRQEWFWDDNRDSENINVYSGPLIGKIQPRRDSWKKMVEQAERLLIYAHRPPYNSQVELAKKEKELRRIHVINWGQHRDLMPEVSGLRWTSHFDELPDKLFHC